MTINLECRVGSLIPSSGIALSILLCALLLAGCGDAEQTSVAHTASGNPPAAESTAAPSKIYEIGTVSPSSLPNTIDLGGTVIPKSEVTLTAQAPGRVVFIVGREGTAVSQGQVVIGLDDDELIAKRKSAHAQLDKAMAAVQNSHVQYGRQVYSGNGPSKGGMGMPSMFDRMFTSPASNMVGYGDQGFDRYADINQARVGYQSAQAAVVQARSQIEEIEAALKDKVAVSPGDAIIIAKYVQIGDSVQPGQPLAKIADSSNLQIQVAIPTRLIPGLSQGMLVPVTIDMGMRVDAVLDQIFPAANPTQHTVVVKFSLQPNSPAAPGMYADVHIPDFASTREPLPAVPTSAIVWRGGQPSVFVVNEDNHVLLRLVRLGEQIGGAVTVLSGLRSGERFLLSPPPAMRSGTAVAG